MRDPVAIGIDPAVWAKFEPGLQRAVASLHGDSTIVLPVVFALAESAAPPAATGGAVGREARQQQAQERQAAFAAETEPLVREMEQMGAQEIQIFWLNRTLSARLTLPAIQALGRRDAVKQIVLAVRQKVGF